MSSRTLRTRLLHPEASAPYGFKSLSTPVFRGSTTLFDNAAQIQDTWNHDEAPYTYGSYGTPTTLELAARVAEIEGARRAFITQAARQPSSSCTLRFLAPAITCSFQRPSTVRAVRLPTESCDGLASKSSTTTPLRQARLLRAFARTPGSSGARARGPSRWTFRMFRRLLRQRTREAWSLPSTTHGQRACSSMRSSTASTSPSRH